MTRWSERPKAFTITPHDTDPLPNIARRIYVGGTGNITLRGQHGAADVVYTALPVGAVIEPTATHVRATGTTATLLIGEGW